MPHFVILFSFQNFWILKVKCSSAFFGSTWSISIVRPVIPGAVSRFILLIAFLTSSLSGVDLNAYFKSPSMSSSSISYMTISSVVTSLLSKTS
jgi:hypothetical protein